MVSYEETLSLYTSTVDFMYIHPEISACNVYYDRADRVFILFYNLVNGLQLNCNIPVPLNPSFQINTSTAVPDLQYPGVFPKNTLNGFIPDAYWLIHSNNILNDTSFINEVISQISDFKRIATIHYLRVGYQNNAVSYTHLTLPTIYSV